MNKREKKISFLFVIIAITIINLNLQNIVQNNEGGDNFYRSNSSPILLDDTILAWYTTWGGDQADSAFSMDIDKENNIYLAGYTKSFGAGDEDLSLLKFNSSGELQWNVTWGDTNRDNGGYIAVDSQGYGYLVGFKNQGVNNNDMWLIKYNSSGQIEWNKQIWPATASFFYIPEDIAVDSDDYIYITGYRYNISMDMTDLILLKYNSLGDLIWDRIWGANNTKNEVGRGIAFDTSDNIYLVSQNSSNYVAFRRNIILLKYNNSGGYQWSKVWNKDYINIGWDITLDSCNNIYITGIRDLTGSGNKDLLLLKYNNTGDFQWNRTWDGSDTDYGKSIVCDSMDNIFITGYTNLLGVDNDILIAKYDSQGNKLWIKVWGPGVNDSGFTIAINSCGNIFIGGIHRATDNNDQILLKLRNLGTFNLTSDADKPDPNGRFNLTWSTSDYADNYSVYMHNSFIYEINGSVTLLDIGITDLNYSISGLTNGIYYYKIVAFNDIGNRNSNCIFVDVKIAPQITFQPTLEYLNTTEPMETDLSLEINCTVTNSTALQWVYLSENSTGIFTNRSMNLGINNEWTYVVDLSTLQRGDKLCFLFYANDSYYMRKNDNNNLNFSLFIGDVYPPSSNVQFNISHIPNFVSKSTLFNIITYDVGERPSGILNFSYKIDLGAWKEYNNPFNLSNLDEGMHTIYYNATDNIGNVEDTNQITVYLDLNNITSFLNFTYYEDSGIKYISNFIEFSIDWNDEMGSGLQILCYKIDSGSYIAFNISFTLTGYSEGLHNISIYSVDNVGNIEPEKVIEIYLDTTPPELNPLSYDLLHSPNYIFDATILSFGGSENYGSLIKNFYWRIDNDNWNIGTNFSLYGFEFGEHTIHYGVIDNVGNSRNGTTVLYLVTPNSDVDTDGLTYSEELVYNTDPFNDDTDGDKLSDGEEVNRYRTNPLSRDTDGDGYSDYDEIFIFMTDPNSCLSSPSAIIITIPIIIVLINFGIWRLKTRNRRKIKKEIIEQVCSTYTKALDNKSIDKTLYRAGSRLNFEKIIKKHEIEGCYILDGSLFITNVGIREFSEILRKVINNICNKELSSQEDSRLIKIGARELLEFQDILYFIILNFR